MDQNYDPVMLELLKMSRELLINEYIDKRAQDHNKWLVESEHLWKTQRIRLAYPEFPPYPNDVDILNRAHKLLVFISTGKIDKESNQVESNPNELDEEDIDQVIETVMEESKETEPDIKPQEGSTTEPKSSKFNDLIPLIRKRLEILRTKK